MTPTPILPRDTTPSAHVVVVGPRRSAIIVVEQVEFAAVESDTLRVHFKGGRQISFPYENEEHQLHTDFKKLYLSIRTVKTFQFRSKSHGQTNEETA